MCGRYTLFPGSLPADLLASIEAAGAQTPALSSGEIRPTNLVPVLRVGPGGQRETLPMVWGFPGWAKPKRDGTPAIPNTVINARGETALQSPMWRDSLRHRRAVVPTTGFIEWPRRHPGDNTAYRFRLPGERLLWLAAIYTLVPDATGGRQYRFSIVTTAANASVADLHDRMPVALRAEEVDIWLHGDYMQLMDRTVLPLVRNRLESSGPEQLSLF